MNLLDAKERGEVDDRPFGLAEIRDLEDRTHEIIENLFEGLHPEEARELELRFSITEAAEMVGRSMTAIRNAEAAGELPEPERVNGRRAGYSLAAINQMRRHFGTLPYRASTDEPAIIAIQNFKGGCGKSTSAIHTAHYLALRGYRILLVDCDPQGTVTALMGVNPDRDVDESGTLYPFLIGERTTLDYAIRKTHWDQLDLVPANLTVYRTEYVIAGQAARAGAEGAMFFLRLREALATVSDRYDIVLIDAPPALGMISLSVLNAANCMLVPLRPGIIDLCSTDNFFTMLRESYEQMLELGLDEPRFKFFKVLINDVDQFKSAHTAIIEMVEEELGRIVLPVAMKDSAEIDNAAMRLRSVYELPKPITSRETHHRAKAFLNALNKEIEFLIRRTWPSHRPQLRKDGLI